MIVSDRHRFVFVHIPKCAGSSVRRELQPYDETGGRFDRRIEEVAGLGPVDLTHLPLDALAAIAPEVYAKLDDPAYASFAVLRDPYERFPSAMAQRLKMFSGVEMAQIGTRALRTEVDRTIANLRAHPANLAPEYIHLRRQADYVIAPDGRRLVGHLYAQDRLDKMMADIAARIGTAPPVLKHANRTEVLRQPALRVPAALAARLGRAILPQSVHKAVRRRARHALMRPAKAMRPEVFATPEIRAFIADHYAADLALWRELTGPAAGTARAGADSAKAPA